MEMPRETPSGCRLLLMRLMWAALGPLAMGILAFLILDSGTGWVTVLDLLYFVFLGFAIYARHADQTSGAATRLDGQPATPADFQRYVRWLVPLSLLVWVASNAIGNHVIAV